MDFRHHTSLDGPNVQAGLPPPHPNLQSSPPPLMTRLINLPPLSQYPVMLHPLLQRHHLPSILFDLNEPLTLAALHPHILTRMPPHREGWIGEPAAFPSDICSLTIRIGGVPRPVVIVAASKLQSGLSVTSFITVWDVLCACHRAWRQARTENQILSESNSLHHHQPSQYIPASRDKQLLLLSNREGVAGVEENGFKFPATQIMTGSLDGTVAIADCYFRTSSHWDGLTKSEMEPDVWILRPSPRVGWR